MTSGVTLLTALAAGIFTVSAVFPGDRFVDQDQQIIARLDTDYQAAVKRNDAVAMDRILDERFVLVLGDGRTASREDLLKEARERHITYEQQDEEAGTQTVRLWGDTAVVTAKLWVKGTRDGVAFDRKLWFSDTYVRTAKGWKYAFGQASLALTISS